MQPEVADTITDTLVDWVQNGPPRENKGRPTGFRHPLAAPTARHEALIRSPDTFVEAAFPSFHNRLGGSPYCPHVSDGIGERRRVCGAWRMPRRACSHQGFRNNT